MVHLGNDWDELLAQEFAQPYYQKLREFLKKEYRTQTVYPIMHDIFNALKATACANVKVVILGQDPYHNPGQAHGMSFSVKEGVQPPPSLLNIYQEIEREYNIIMPRTNGYLMPWAKQGVLLLNTVLTVRENQPNSHKGNGWEEFTDSVIRLLNQKTEPCVFLLWGANAKSKAALLDNPAHLVLSTVHPSPLSAHRGFFGCGHFQKANDFLIQHQLSPIDWQL